MLRSEIFENDEAVHTTESARITPAHERRSGVYLTKYEVARIVGERARQIVNGTSIMSAYSPSKYNGRSALEIAERCTDPKSFAMDPIYIAKMDLLQKRIPMIVQRVWPDGKTENIPVSELRVDKVMLDLSV